MPRDWLLQRLKTEIQLQQQLLIGAIVRRHGLAWTGWHRLAVVSQDRQHANCHYISGENTTLHRRTEANLRSRTETKTNTLIHKTFGDKTALIIDVSSTQCRLKIEAFSKRIMCAVTNPSIHSVRVLRQSEQLTGHRRFDNLGRFWHLYDWVPGK